MSETNVGYLSASQLKTIEITLVVVTGGVGMSTGVMLGQVHNFFQKKCHFWGNVTVSKASLDICSANSDKSVLFTQ
jgi:hypothetical protein